MFKVLGGIGRSVPLYNGKARILVKAIIPAAPKCLAEMQSICEANGWKSVLDERVTWSFCLLFPLTLTGFPTAP